MTYEDLILLKKRAAQLRMNLTETYYQDAFDYVVNHAAFLYSPGSSTKHHNWTGGLFQHTIEVAEIGLKMADVIELNRDILTVSSMWHDFGKIWAYESSGALLGSETWCDSKLKSKTGGHLARSYGEFMIWARTSKMPNLIVEEIMHCILAHHGCREWGSPARPQTKEAWVLHLADGASARCLGKEI